MSTRITSRPGGAPAGSPPSGGPMRGPMGGMMGMPVQKAKDFKGTLRRLFGYLKPYQTQMIAEYELDSIAVALLWSFANPAHEKALAEAISQVIPEVFVSCSSEVSPRLGEYEPTVATVLNGYVGPACARYLSELKSRLATPLLVMQSNGGVLPESTATPRDAGRSRIL